jgi:hypothetical protein
MTETTSDNAFQAVRYALDRNYTFQRRWQTVNMVAYVLTSVGTVGCTTGATLVGHTDGGTAALLAGIATFLVTVEKSLMFREKWKLHLNIVTQLDQIRLGLLTSVTTPEQALARMSDLLSEYATELPIAPREQ